MLEITTIYVLILDAYVTTLIFRQRKLFRLQPHERHDSDIKARRWMHETRHGPGVVIPTR